MRSSKKLMLSVVVIAVLVVPARARAGSCDFVLRWDEQAIRDCFKELKSEVSLLRMHIQTEQMENSILRSNLCLLAMDNRTETAVAVAADACAELKARGEWLNTANTKISDP